MKKNKNDEATGVGSPSTEAVCTMFTNAFWINALWLTDANSDFLIESFVKTRPPALMGREGAEALLRKFSKIEILSWGDYNKLIIHSSHEYLMFTKRLSNLGAEQILRLTEINFGASVRFSATLPVLECYLRYRAQGQSVLSFEWTGGADYGFYDTKDSTVETAAPPEYIEYYDQRKKIDIAIMPRPESAKLQDLYIYMIPDENRSVRHFIFQQRPVAYDSLVSGVQQPIALAPASDAALFGYFPEKNFPEMGAGRAPVDSTFVGDLVTPPGSTELVGVMDDGESIFVGYRSVDKKSLKPAESAISAVTYKISPYSQVFHAGDAKERLGFVYLPMPGVNWSVTGDAGGTLVKEGTDHFYVPALKPPGVAFSVPGETLIPAATRASFPRVPARTDVLTAAGDGMSDSVSFVTTFVYPTHFIRFTLAGNALQLNCWYFNLDMEETAVPAEDVEWHILAGNGVVSAQGVFTPASTAPSDVTVVMALDTRNVVEWRFAVTIIPLPLLSAYDALRLQQA
ncbi:hypothetical protein CWR53_06815 [Pseudomonas sp. SGAir0191]|uniref:hypothetical protein n=1 Tax=Pseudomonas sp. SGAir0191 TaxID=2217867 RepID=UPI0010FC436C|nr:hypothetical protein [Pseudomonas sp. SGAir0191]AUA32325.2 hypothetical protein CWR53_06815 [Pseudomonas sp. SGAir0191]